MPLISEIPIQKGETFATVYNDTVGTSFVEYTFSSVQNTLFIHNNGSRNIMVEVGGKQQQVDTGGTLRITEDTDRFKIKSKYGTQPFQAEGRTNIDSIDAGARADISTLATQLSETGKLDDAFLAYSLLGSMLDGKESQVLQLLGDSTGNEETEWFYLLVQKIKEKYPNYNVKYAVYDTANNRYPVFSDIGATGTERSLRYNGAGYLHSIGKEQISLTSSDLDVRIKLSLDNWTGGVPKTLISKFGAAGNRGWRLILNASNLLVLEWTEDGTTLKSLGFSANASQFTNGIPTWIRATLDVDNAASGHVVTFYKSDDGITWTQLSTHTGTGVTSIFNSNQDYEVGGNTGNGQVITGNIYATQILDGIDGADLCPKPIDAWKPNPNQSEANWAGQLTGTPTLYVYNGSIPGYGIDNYSDPTLVRKMIKSAVFPLVFVSISHNDRGYRNKVYYDKLKTLTDTLKSFCYEPNVVFLTQNPKYDTAQYATEHTMRRRLIINFAKNNRFSFIDTFHAFVKDSRDITELVNPDGIHPANAGSILWADTVWKYLNIV